MIFGVIKKLSFMKMSSLLTLLSINAVWVYGQDNNLEAQYLYTKAEESYTNGNFSSAIKLLEKTTEKLGSTNLKILYLQIKSYQNKIDKDCTDSIKQDSIKIYTYIDYFFKLSNSDYPKEKYFEILDAKEKISSFFANGGCEQQKLVLISAKYNCKLELYSQGEIFGIKIIKVNDGIFSKAKIHEGFIITGVNGKTISSVDDLINDLMFQKQNFKLFGIYPGYDGTYNYSISL